MRKDEQTDRYTYRVTWSEDDAEYVGLVAEMPSLSWLAKTDTAALAGIKKLAREVVADMIKSNEEIPKAIAMASFSGQFKVRVPPTLHRRLTIEAAENKVSLNRLISMKLAHG